MDYLEHGRAVIQAEADTLLVLRDHLDQSFSEACSLLLACRGKIIVTGIGKSGHIARKIAATLASTGTPALFMHPAEAAHGDIGLIKKEDIVLALSYSGENHEIHCLLPVIALLGCPLLSICGSPRSRLAQAATIHLPIYIDREACPLNLAPTSSTTAMLALGDALAITLSQARGFTAADFARSHPSGRLGRRLLLRIADIMRTGAQLPCVSHRASITEALLEVSRKGLGMTAVVNDDHSVIGIFTDGDLRRVLDQPSSTQNSLHNTPISTVMTRSFVSIEASRLAVDAFAWMEENRITALLVLDDHSKLIGAFNIHDLLQHDLISESASFSLQSAPQASYDTCV